MISKIKTPFPKKKNPPIPCLPTGKMRLYQHTNGGGNKTFSRQNAFSRCKTKKTKRRKSHTYHPRTQSVMSFNSPLWCGPSHAHKHDHHPHSHILYANVPPLFSPWWSQIYAWWPVVISHYIHDDQLPRPSHKAWIAKHVQSNAKINFTLGTESSGRLF